ncbi:hypothetical protein BH11PSE4_BH11PSE4_07070 [soil metagenome]
MHSLPSRSMHAQLCCVVFLLCAASTTLGSARAEELDAKVAASAGEPQAVKHGELVFHGNYCGIGNRAGADPVDALDVACMHHDACTPSGKVDCACNERLVEEATAVARDPAQPAELQSLATLTAAAATAGLGLCVTTAQGSAAAPQVSTAPSQPVDLSPPVEGTVNATQAPVAPVPPPTAEHGR